VTPAQRAALDVLPERRRRFVLAYVGEAAGNATQAARTAGYAKPAEEGCRLLKHAQVRGVIDSLRTPSASDKRASKTIDDLRELWAEMAWDEEADRPSRLKASELLGKSQGAFVERHEHTGATGTTQIAIVINAGDEHARIVDLARGSGE
jgi:phage terminase small subunit